MSLFERGQSSWEQKTRLYSLCIIRIVKGKSYDGQGGHLRSSGKWSTPANSPTHDASRETVGSASEARLGPKRTKEGICMYIYSSSYDLPSRDVRPAFASCCSTSGLAPSSSCERDQSERQYSSANALRRTTYMSHPPSFPPGHQIHPRCRPAQRHRTTPWSFPAIPLYLSLSSHARATSSDAHRRRQAPLRRSSQLERPMRFSAAAVRVGRRPDMREAGKPQQRRR